MLNCCVKSSIPLIPCRQQNQHYAYRDALKQRHLTQDLNVSQLVKVEVPLPLHIVHLQLELCDLQVQAAESSNNIFRNS